MAKKQKTANLPRRRPVSPAPKQKRPQISLAFPALPNWSTYIGAGALALVLVVSALLRGLYFRTDQLYVGMVVLLVGAAALFVRRVHQSDWEISWADVAVLGFVIFGWLSVLWAVEERLAVQQAIVYTIAGVIYLYARTSGEGRLGPALLWALGGVAVVSWLMAGAIWQYPAAIGVDRLSGPFQYPDTAGAIYLATWLGAAIVQFATPHRSARLGWGGLAGLSAYLFALTLSRGAWVVAPFVIVAFVGIIRPGRRIGALAGALLLGLVVFGLAAVTIPHFNNIGSHYALAFGIVAIVLGAAIAEAVDWLHASAFDRWQVALAVLLIVLVLGVGAVTYRARHGVAMVGQTTVALHLPQGRDTLSLQLSGSGSAAAQIVSLDRFGTQTTIGTKTLQSGSDEWRVTVPKGSQGAQLLSQGKGSLRLDAVAVDGTLQSLWLVRAIPQSLYDRLLGISGTDLSVWERIDFWHDGMKMFAKSPIIGFGGNAWQTIYQHYQSFNYSSNQAHSSLVDAAVSYGIFGIAFILLMGAALLLALRRSWGKGHIAGASTVAGAAIFLHSLIDFDLSIASSLLVLWLSLGAMPQVRLAVLRKADAWLVRTAAVLLGAIGVWAIVLVPAAATEAASKPPSLVQLRHATSLDPLSASLHLELAQTELQQAASSTASNAIKAAAVRDANAAYRLNPNNLYIATLEAQVKIDQKDYQGALATLRVAEQDQPMNPSTYQNYIDVATSLATQALGQKKLPEARADLGKAWGMYESFRTNAAASTKVAPQYLQMPAAPAALELYAGEAGALLGHTQAAVSLLKAATAGGQSTTANLWLAALGAGSNKIGRYQYATESQWLSEARMLR